MEFLNIFKKDNNSTNVPMNSANEADMNNRIEKINLAKDAVRKVCLTKKPLQNLTSRVGLVLDYSGSMDWMYDNGTIQNLIEKIIPIALQFDDNGSMEVWIFENGYHRLPDINMNNFYNYVEREITSKYLMGGTYYAPVMEDVVKRYTKQEKSNNPNYVIFITDGDNSDHSETTNVITKCADKPIFWEFVGVGNSSFSYLEKLDDLTGRYVDNADFFSVSTANDITYEKLLNEYPQWLENPKVKEMLSR